MTVVQAAPKSYGSQLIESRPAQWTIGFIKECHTYRNNTDFFEKIFQVANAALQLIIIAFGYTYFSRLSLSLSTVVMHDFYNFLKWPKKWLEKVNRDSIDEKATFDSLKAALQQEIDPMRTNVPEVERLADMHLKERLSIMRDTGDGFENKAGFKNLLLKQMNDADPVKNPKNSSPFSLKDLKLKDFHVTVRRVPFIEKLTNFTWILVDIGTVGYFFQKWNLLDTAKWGERIGSIPGFQWVPTNSFDTWVVGGICSGFGLKLAEATRKLFDEALTDQERRQARWDVVTASAESIYWGSMFLNRIGQIAIEGSTLQWLAIGAKTFGLVSIICNSGRHQFFQAKTAPSAWFFQGKTASAA